jgi:mannose-6-phosphate isomerase
MPARFPLLIKILDARQTLSLQVHPPSSVAAQLGGEPKTELWYVAQAGAEAELFVGLKKGVTRSVFEQELAAQTVAECFHRICPKSGDAMFLPSGRVHALGRDLVIFEVQQNSDTTYRVFDWNRIDGSGNARQLHVEQSLASIDFDDFEPSLLPQTIVASGRGTIHPLVQNDLFEVAVRTLPAGEDLGLTDGRMQIIGIVSGTLRIESAEESLLLRAGQFCLLPAECDRISARAETNVSFLQIY